MICLVRRKKPFTQWNQTYSTLYGTSFRVPYIVIVKFLMAKNMKNLSRKRKMKMRSHCRTNLLAVVKIHQLVGVDVDSALGCQQILSANAVMNSLTKRNQPWTEL